MKFKVGDYVKILPTAIAFKDCQRGDSGIVVSVLMDNLYKVKSLERKCSDLGWTFNDHEIEHDVFLMAVKNAHE